MSLESLLSLVGTTLAGKYRLSSVLGSGGMGVVYRAEQVGLGGRSVAVKLLRRDLIATRFEWFRAEAMAASRINHPHAVAIYDFGVTRDEVPYLVMEHLRGESLTTFIEGDQLTIDRVVGIGAQVLSALDEAHNCGVVHCDLTANNVIVEHLRGGQDFAKVIDFGLARLMEPAGAEPHLLGTAEYMAPEQIRGDLIQPATDLYATGILLYEMIAKRTPFQGGSAVATLRGHLDAEPAPLGDIVPHCPPDIAEIVGRSLAKNPEDRPESAAAMRRELLMAMNANTPANATAQPRLLGPDSRRTFAGGSGKQPSPRSTGEIPRSDRLGLGSYRSQSPVRGRTEEFDQLLEWSTKPNPGPIAIVGPPGIGKGRLIQGLSERTRSPGRCFVTAADPSGMATSWYPILHLLENILDLRPPVDLQQLRRAAARAVLTDRDVPGLAELFAVEGPSNILELAVRRREGHAAALRALQSVKRNNEPLIFCFVDFDKFDRPSQDIVRSLAAAPPGRGVPRVLVTAEKAPDFASELLELKGLDPVAGHQLAIDLIGSKEATPEPKTIHDLTAGNPAAIEQLAGWISIGHVAADLPSLLVDVITVRVNRLQVAQRKILQSVAAHGTVAPRWAVEACASAEEIATLSQPVWTGLMVIGDDALTIPSEMVANTVWACTPADVRRRLNLQILQTLAGVAPPGQLGRHAEGSDELGDAFNHYLQAGWHAESRFDDAGAARWFERATAMARVQLARGVRDAAARMVTSSIALARVLHFTHQPRLAIGVLDEAALHPHTDRNLAAATHIRGLVASADHNRRDACSLFEEAAGSAMRAGDRELLCQIYLDLAQYCVATDDDERAIAELEQGIDVITAGGGLAKATEPKLLWRMGLELSERYSKRNNPEQARKIAGDTLAFVRRGGWVHARGRISAVLADLAEQAQDSGAATRYRTAAIEDMRTLGDRRSTAELLLAAAEAARSSRTRSPNAIENSWSADPRDTLRAARLLAREIGWSEGLARMSSEPKSKS